MAGFFSWLGLGKKSKKEENKKQEVEELQNKTEEASVEEVVTEVPVKTEERAPESVEPEVTPEEPVKAEEIAPEVLETVEPEVTPEEPVKAEESVSEVLETVEPEVTPEEPVKVEEIAPEVLETVEPEVTPEEPVKVEESVSEVLETVEPEVTPKEPVKVEEIAPEVLETVEPEVTPEEPVKAEESVSEVLETVEPEVTPEELVKAEESVSEVATEVVEAAPKLEEEKVKVKKSFFERLRKTRENLSYGLSALIVGKKIDEDLYEDLETALLTADLGVETTEYVIEKLKSESRARDLHDASALKANLKKILTDILKPCEQPLVVEKKGDMPFVILMVGVNGAGKTTTIGKLALKFKSQGLKVMLGAGDTFRAAAVEQLKEWGERTAVPVISQPTGSDSASVLFDALSSAKSKNIDVLICDTAGRLQNKDNLMEELKKIVRVMKKISEDVPHEVLLVLDSTTGQNAVSQMKLFSEAVQVTGLALTKLDGSAKGGVVFALADKFKTPVRFVGIGEKTEDLRVFDVENFVDALIGDSL